jgi:adenine C2-methylase RlmN of 23S rRNA A2503 and tRNA A37
MYKNNVSRSIVFPYTLMKIRNINSSNPNLRELAKLLNTLLNRYAELVWNK